MSRRALIKLGVASVILLPIIVLLLLKFCFISPEERIRRAIHHMIDAFEKEEAGAVLSHVSEEYADDSGLDYPEIERLVNEAFVEFDDLKVFLSDLEVKAEGDSASASFKMAVLARFEGSLVFLLGSFNQPVTGKCIFSREKGSWKVRRTEGLT